MPIVAFVLTGLLVFPFAGNFLYFALDETINPPEAYSWRVEVLIRIGFLVVVPLVLTTVTGVLTRQRLSWVIALALASAGVCFFAIYAVVGICDGCSD